MAGAGADATNLDATAWRTVETVEDAISALCLAHADSAKRLRAAFAAFVDDEIIPPSDARYPYPCLRVTYRPTGPVPPHSSAFGKFESPGIYQTDIARPDLFVDYLQTQLQLLLDIYGDDISFSVGPSTHDIPYPYVLESPSAVDSDAVPPATLARYFPVPNLATTDDSVADGAFDRPAWAGAQQADAVRPLSLFGALRTDYSLQRLRHYTGTDPADFQQFILFTNYQRYVDEFFSLGLSRMGQADSPYTRLTVPGGVTVDTPSDDALDRLRQSDWRKYQMPAYHLCAEGQSGITLINIGVGPSNTKTITDHLAVLRPQCWLMIGHCGGLRHSQRLGDYVLAHAYLRRDRVLDHVLPVDIPIPPIAEMQVALEQAAAKVTGDAPKVLKRRLRTGTVVTHADRNWELRFEEESRTLDKARAIAIDMESATLAANGYRFRVPYGTLLCVSDKPLHGEIKLPGAANRFYEKAIGEHMQIGLAAMESLRGDAGNTLHSRKLRSFDEPPFR